MTRDLHAQIVVKDHQSHPRELSAPAENPVARRGSWWLNPGDVRRWRTGRKLISSGRSLVLDVSHSLRLILRTASDVPVMNKSICCIYRCNCFLQPSGLVCANKAELACSSPSRFSRRPASPITCSDKMMPRKDRSRDPSEVG